MSISYSQLLLLGTLAGFTIFLGLPLVYMPRVGHKAKSFLNVFSAGVLIFLLYEIIEEVLEELGSAWGNGETGEASGFAVLFLVCLAAGLGGLLLYEKRYIRTDKNIATKTTGASLALMIAIGIGLHNFGEGLAIGQAFIQGSMILAVTLVVGFGLHNATEGFGIVAPLSGDKPRFGYVALLGLIGGGPTFLGTLVGSFVASELLEIIFLSLAAGSILYVVVKLLQLQYKLRDFEMAAAGAVCGFLLAWAGEWVTKLSMGS
ncbi:MAG: ZIP family metal transporter [candidate division Zixibacteria bacterium]|nr:ZIP family metal transporter [candidate division Zixibacteria bacterium]